MVKPRAFRSPSLLALVLPIALIGSSCSSARDRFDPLGVPNFPQPVNDIQGVLSNAQERELNEALGKLQARTDIRMVVLVIPHTGKEKPQAYAKRIYNGHNLGGRGPNDGVLVVIAIEQKDIWTEIGGDLINRINRKQLVDITRSMVPFFKRKDYAAGIRHGTLAYIAELSN